MTTTTQTAKSITILKRERGDDRISDVVRKLNILGLKQAPGSFTLTDKHGKEVARCSNFEEMGEWLDTEYSRVSG